MNVKDVRMDTYDFKMSNIAHKNAPTFSATATSSIIIY